MRVTIYLPDEQVELLNAYRKDHGISRAAAIRRGIEVLLERDSDPPAERRRAVDAFGMWKDRAIDAVESQRKLRAEWDR